MTMRSTIGSNADDKPRIQEKAKCKFGPKSHVTVLDSEFTIRTDNEF